MSGEHLLLDSETKNIAEGFLAAAPWFGDVVWGQHVVGPGAEYLGGWTGVVPDDAELTDDQRWSWTVTFSDAGGTSKTLTHDGVLEGLKEIVYGTLPDSLAYGRLAIRQWFTEPAETRRQLDLKAPDKSLICQYALYGKKVFSTGDMEAVFGKKLDFFESQRPTELADEAASLDLSAG